MSQVLLPFLSVGGSTAPVSSSAFPSCEPSSSGERVRERGDGVRRGRRGATSPGSIMIFNVAGRMLESVTCRRRVEHSERVCEMGVVTLAIHSLHRRLPGRSHVIFLSWSAVPLVRALSLRGDASSSM